MPNSVLNYFPFVLLNWAVRYFPILRALEGRLPANGLVLDIGSGSIGLAAFYRRRFVGCDVTFPSKPRQPMIPVRCSGTRLPFADGSFPGVVASDVLEHVPPEYRHAVVNESLRVAQKFAVFGFPSGPTAYESDRNLCEYLKEHGIPFFDWLKEHMLYPYPDRSLFEGVSTDWLLESFQNENVHFHEWVTIRESSKFVKGLVRVLLTLAPQAVALLLRLADRPPCYRTIVVATKKTNTLGGITR